MIPRLWRFSKHLETHPSFHYLRFSPFSTGSVSVIDGKSIAKDIRTNVADEICKMKNCIGKCPGLGIVLVGERQDSHAFIRLKLRACQEVGIAFFLEQLPQDCSRNEVADVVSDLNNNPDVHGVIVQLPLPQHLNEDEIVEFVSPEKDVDGLHPLNIGMLAMGRDPLFMPCAPKACIELLLRQGVEIASSRAVVLGRSKISGLPASFLLQSHLATVSTLHVFTDNPEHVTRQADILISDVGIPNLVRGHWLKPGAVVIDMGAKQVKDPSRQHGYRITGDICYEEAIKVTSAITPVPGGVGPVTISMLLSNTLESAKRAFRAHGGHVKVKGTIYLSNIRMVFVASKTVGNFYAFDMPLLYVHGEKFNQPIFHCNNISGSVEPVVPDNEHRALYSTHSFKILFKDGGCGTFVPLFLNLMNSVRQYNQHQHPHVGTETRVDPLQAAQTPVDEMMRHAYVDPNDPTKIFLQQPTPASQLRRRTYQSQPDEHTM